MISYTELDGGWGQVRASSAAAVPSVREILFIVATVVGRYEPDFLAFQQRFKAAGKPPKVVHIALAHKPLVRLNAKAREARQRLETLPPDSMDLTAGTR